MIPASSTLNTSSVQPAPKPPRAARLGLHLLSKLDTGHLTITDPNGQTRRFGSHGLQASIRLNNWRVFQEAMRSGDIGFAESYIRHDWDTDSLVDTLTLLMANRHSLEQAIYGSWTGRLFHRIRHLLNRNSKSGSKRNIHAHYDLGNDFYSLWLDPSMTYSSALFSAPEQSLEQGQVNKYERMLKQAACEAGDRILEIGCGWGGFAQTAAATGVHVTGLTLSAEQQKYARARMVESDGEKSAEFVLRDYRDESSQYDAIVSIEMFEAVGEQYWSQYFEAIHRCLKPGGRAVVQTITIHDALFARYRMGTDFIQQYIFPGGMLPSIERFTAEANKHQLTVIDQHRFGQDYARTLRSWRDSFIAHQELVCNLGFDERFIRTWEFYLAYCEAAFTTGNTDVCQFTLQAER